MKKMLTVSLMLFCFISADDFFEPTTTLGGYGELHWNMEGQEMDFHRFIVFLNHNFDENWSLKSEIELEHNMAGDGYGGYIALEQAYINYLKDDFEFKGGVVLAPVGIINPTHEPPTFLSVERPDYAKYIIPTTWFGNGLAFGYKMGDFSFGLTLMEDIIGTSWTTDEDSGVASITGGAITDTKYAFRSGRGKGDDSWATSLTKIINFGWTGMEGLKVGGSFVMNDMPTILDGDFLENAPTIGLSMNEINVSYNKNNLIAVFETGSGSFGMDDWNSTEGFGATGSCSDNVSADEATCVGGGGTWTVTNGSAAKGFEGMRFDIGYNVGSLLADDCELYVWTRMTSWDANNEVSADKNTGEVSKSLFGVTWKPKHNISFKIETGTHDVEWTGGSKSSDIMNFGIGYMF